MRRLGAASVPLACSVPTTACGLVDTDEPRPELGRLEIHQGKGYRIKLPCTPAKISQQAPVSGRVKTLTVTTWSCEGPDSAYAVSTMALPADVQGNIEGSAQGGADAVDGTVVMNKRTRYAGLPARDIRIESVVRGKPATMFGRVLIHERVHYQVQSFAFGKHTKEPPKLYAKILASLSFK